MLIFNPPYVPTPPEEVGSEGIEAAWAGGLDGREVIDRLLPIVADLLSPRGCFYMVLVEENKPAEISQLLALQGLSSRCVLKKRAKNEGLSIWRFDANAKTNRGAATTTAAAGTIGVADGPKHSDHAEASAPSDTNVPAGFGGRSGTSARGRTATPTAQAPLDHTPDNCFAAIVQYVDALTLAKGLRRVNRTNRDRMSTDDVAQWCASSRVALLKEHHVQGDLPLGNLFDHGHDVATGEHWTLERLWLAECPPRFPRLYFDFASDVLNEEGQARLQDAVDILIRHPGLQV